jgi:competence protein ComEA
MNRILRSILWAGIALVSGAVCAGPVDINTADAETLAAELQGVGMARARAIVEYRESQGPFARPEDLLAVRGVGPAILEQNAANIQVGGEQADGD